MNDMIGNAYPTAARVRAALAGPGNVNSQCLPKRANNPVSPPENGLIRLSNTPIYRKFA